MKGEKLGKIVLTGFGDYEKDGVIIRDNPSQIAVDRFIRDSSRFKDFQLIGTVLDANNKVNAGSEMRNLLDQHHPAVFLALGMKTAGTESLLFEQEAMNINNQGLNLRAKMRFDEIVAECNQQGILARLLSDAGNGTCNFIYYEGLKHIEARRLLTVMCFIHIPLLPNTIIIGKDRTPEMSLDIILRAMSITLTYLLKYSYASDN